MKIYTLVIAYNDDTEEIEYISEEIEGSAKSVLEESGVVKIGDYFDEDDLDFISGCYIIGEA